ncbi:heavy-metal-associated domain-containing protein [Paenalkalicoccus suaedae]|uniref:Heavy-metal-associated domain-containing protein n=1 Tax=Paenalkalicoccus suaedae TaxID=2592382 RepID=A0A859FEP6_9BACI|nr:cation transporter [Paenalkalicoccus suaedae]QKS71340.1 heavy-metal-associated domain-containing protein [Paenalkalicoccus suaedae]
MKSVVLQVEGMTCGHCKSAVEGAALSVDGVKQAAVDLAANTVSVEMDEQVDVNLVKQEIEDQGYDVN